jgi:hypothetical protein
MLTKKCTLILIEYKSVEIQYLLSRARKNKVMSFISLYESVQKWYNI